MDAASFCGSGALATRVADFLAEGLDAPGIASLTDGDLQNVNGQPLDAHQLDAHRLRRLLYEVRPDLLAAKGDEFEAAFQSLADLRATDWEGAKARMRNELHMQLGDITKIQAKLHPALPAPADPLPLAAFPPVDVKVPAGDGRGGKVPKARRKKDRNAPKRPRNAYLVFLDRHRPALQAAQPHSAMKELTKEMAKEWQNVTPEERATCDAIAHQNKLAYEEAMRAYQQQQMAAAAAADGGASGM